MAKRHGGSRMRSESTLRLSPTAPTASRSPRRRSIGSTRPSCVRSCTASRDHCASTANRKFRRTILDLTSSTGALGVDILNTPSTGETCTSPVRRKTCAVIARAINHSRAMMRIPIFRGPPNSTTNGWSGSPAEARCTSATMCTWTRQPGEPSSWPSTTVSSAAYDARPSSISITRRSWRPDAERWTANARAWGKISGTGPRPETTARTVPSNSSARDQLPEFVNIRVAWLRKALGRGR